MKRKGFILVIVCMLLISLIVAGCSVEEESAQTGDAPEIKTVGFSVYDMTYQFCVVIADGARDAAEKHGMTINFQDAAIDSTRQVEHIENFITQKVDAIISYTIDDAVVTPLVQQAKEAGIPVISMWTPVDGATVNMVVDEYEYGYIIGKMAGQWAAENYPDEEVEAVILTVFDYKPGIQRREGMTDAFSKYFPTGKIVAVENSDTTVLGMEVTETLMQAYPNLKIIMADSDDTGAIGAAEALNSIVPESERHLYAVFGADAVPEAISRMKEPNTLYRGTIDVMPYAAGEAAIELLAQLFAGENIEELFYQPFIEVDIDKALSDY